MGDQSTSRAKTIWRDVSGIIVLDKPKGLSSNTALQRVRHIYRARKAGHTGSLDPLATGQLPICLGEAAKVAGYLLDSSKTYHATLMLGSKTQSGDAEGQVIETMRVPDLDAARVASVMQAMMGKQQQIPPMYSALKQAGQPLYRLARQGLEVARAARAIEIFALELLQLESPQLQFEVHCSKGTYVRTLAEDLAQRLGTVGHLIALKRTRIGQRDWVARSLDELEAARGQEDLLDSWLYPTDSGVSDWPSLHLSATQYQSLVRGQPVVGLTLSAHTRYRLYSPDGFVGLGVSLGCGQVLKSLRLLATAAPTASRGSGDCT
jgi:tRNA pseudouridine55 synthase